ncbi:MAG: conjugative transposon protein TraM [Prevotella sp.]|jgi:conjugative transposon TraM protein|nr:conjugative transposon protein TraM [Prevotella sp.]
MEQEEKKGLEQSQGGASDSSSPEGQKNERQKQEPKPRKELTEEEKLKRNKMMVFGAAVIGMVVIVLWLFSSLGGGSDDAVGRSGFNTEMPDADKGSTGIADKSKAYEMDGVKKNLQARHDLGAYSVSETDSVAVTDDMNLMAKAEHKDEEVSPAKQRVQQSAAACNELNQTLGSFYQPSGDAANEELKNRIAELEQKLSSQTSANNTVDDQMALMEKSYQLAAKYMPAAQGGSGQVAYAGAGEQGTSGQQGKKRKVSPVQQVAKTVVSALSNQAYDSQDDDGGFAFNSFNTAVGANGGVSRKNTISASVYGYQTVTDGQTVRLRLLEPMAVDERIIPKNSIVVGSTKIQGERLCITITSIENGRMIIPVELSVYDTDGQEGIFIPNSMEVSAAKEVAANMGGSMGSSINISSDAKAQLVSDVGKGLIQGTSQYVAKKMRTVKVHLKAGYQVLLYQKEN